MHLLVVTIILFSLSLNGQNLVPNSGFEIYSTCPDDQDQLSYATGWYKPTANSTDYYNACSTIPQFSFSPDVPSNYAGYQSAHSGNAYIGFVAHYQCSFNCREYSAIQLLDTLVAGRTYCVEFWVSAADSSLEGVASIGAYFSNSMINDQSTIEHIPASAQVVSDPNTPIVDTLNWTRISGTFTAQGGELFIILGLFLPDSLIVSDTIRPHLSNNFAYYFLDDVSVVQVANCVAGNDMSICYRDSIQLGVPPQPNIVYSWLPVEGLSNPNISNPTASPDTTITYTLTQMECDAVSTSSVTVTVDHGCHSAPTIIIPSILFGNQNLFISGLESNSKLELFDERGRLVFSQEDYQNDFWSTNLTQGMYVARLTRPSGETLQQKVGVVR